MIIHRVDLPTGKKYTHYIFHFDPEVFFKCIRPQKSPMCWKMVQATFGCSSNKLAAVRQTPHARAGRIHKVRDPPVHSKRNYIQLFLKVRSFFNSYQQKNDIIHLLFLYQDPKTVLLIYAGQKRSSSSIYDEEELLRSICPGDTKAWYCIIFFVLFCVYGSSTIFFIQKARFHSHQDSILRGFGRTRTAISR